MKPLFEACIPRNEIFNPNDLELREDIETVLKASTGKDFFEKTHITESLERIIRNTMMRLAGQNPTGVIKLKQAMGGGKTHSQLAVGLLAKNPSWVKEVCPKCKIYPKEPASVVVIDGRKNYDYGIWTEIAAQLGQPDHFKNPHLLQAPDERQWRTLLEGSRTLILIDELPPYLERVKGIQVGSSDLAVQTCAALGGLLTALSREGTEQCALIISDLVTEYEEESAEIARLIARFTKEIDRGCEEIEPVNLGSEEVYQILRKRIFQELPEREVIEDIRKKYRKALTEGARAKLCPEDADAQSGKILHTYPFSPAFKDLFTRFRQNPRFRQTRGMLKLLAAVTGTIWKNGRAKTDLLIGPEHLDLENASVLQEVETINSGLKNAMVRDVSTQAGDATIQLEETREGAIPWIGDAGRILLFASLSANDLEQGLNRLELGAACAVPDRDLQDLDGVIDTLVDTCRYLHRGENGRLRFRNIENIRVWVKNRAVDMSDSKKEDFVRDYLKKQFEPKERLLYSNVQVFPSVDEVELTPDRLTLLIKQPKKPMEAANERNEFFASQRYKNQILILSGAKNGWKEIMEAAGILAAIKEGLARTDLANGGSEKRDLEEMEVAHKKKFLESLIRGFGEVYYPVGGELAQATIRLELDPGHRDTGERQIVAAVRSAGKYEDFEGASKEWVEVAERVLFSAKSTPWREIREKSAEVTEWSWSSPGALDRLKAIAEESGWWRKDGESRVERGPFELTPTSVDVTANEDETELSLRTNPPDAKVHYAVGTNCSPKDKLVGDKDKFQAPGRVVTFLAVDPSGKQKTGEVTTWESTPKLKHDVMANRAVRLACEDDPEADIFYVEGDFDPLPPTGKKYSAPFKPEPDTKVVCAVAVRGKKRSKPRRFPVGDSADSFSHIRSGRSVEWTKLGGWIRTGVEKINELLNLVSDHKGSLEGLYLRAKGGEQNGELVITATQEPRKVMEAYAFLIGLMGVTERSEQRSLKAKLLVFPTLEELKEFASKAGETLKPTEINNAEEVK
jgi:hypothetical protein